MSAAFAQSASAPLRIFHKETKYEFLKLLRTRSFSLSIIGFPVMFYVLFGIANRNAYAGNVHIAKYMLGSYACFGLIGAALFGIGVGLAGELAAGWLELKRASPMPASCLSLRQMRLRGRLRTHHRLHPHPRRHMLRWRLPLAIELIKMLGLTIVGSITFACMGLLLALIVPANAAPGIVNLIYLPMSFLSGLWMPIRFMPHWLQRIAPILPTYHLSQLMLQHLRLRRRHLPRHPLERPHRLQLC